MYAYAQWKSAEQRENAFANSSNQELEVGDKMKEAIDETLPVVKFEVISDYLKQIP
jgi:hypothetical protein